MRGRAENSDLPGLLALARKVTEVHEDPILDYLRQDAGSDSACPVSSAMSKGPPAEDCGQGRDHLGCQLMPCWRRGGRVAGGGDDLTLVKIGEKLERAGTGAVPVLSTVISRPVRY